MQSSSTSLIQTIKVDVPRAFLPLLKPARYKGAYGGRGGAKSHFFAEQMILRCFAAQTRAVCIREIQLTIKDSVKQLLVDKIAKFGLQSYFDVLETEIRGRHNGSLIVFRGMQSYNADNIKSLEGFDIAWIEEGQTLSEKSLELLRPTIRKPGSEIWAGWNPRHRTDAIDKFFRKNPHPEAVSVLVNWRDNPWFPEVLRKEMEHDKAVDPDTAEHIWEGGYGIQSGSILGRWMSAADKEKRIHDGVAFDPKGPAIEISSDIGFRDTAGWWFWQRKIGGFSLLKYVGDSGMEAADWIERLNSELKAVGWPLGKIYLPADAEAKTFATKHTALAQFRQGFGAGKVAIVPKTSIADRINAGRTVIRQCEFHETNCEQGLDGLRAWEFLRNPDLQIFTKEPLHNWASHPSDAFTYGCQMMRPKDNADKKTSGKMDRWRDAFKKRDGEASQWKTT